MASKNTVEINGKLYDAHSGKLLAPRGANTHLKASKSNSVKVKAAGKHGGKPKFIDGIQHGARSSKVQTTPQPKKPAATSTKSTKAARTSGTRLTQKVQKARTLHRRGLVVPSFDVQSESLAKFIPKNDLSVRLERAMKVHKSSVVRRFSSPVVASGQAALNSLEQMPATTKSAEAALSKTTSATPPSTPDATAPKTPVAHKKQRSSKRSYRKHFSLAGGITTALAVLVLSGYVAYLNIPSVSLKVAASQAGFSASLPGYKPVGYSLNGPVRYSSGLVTINYSSEAGGAFSLDQQPTTWDSEALKESIESSGADVYTRQDSGLSVYFSDGKASWVDSGKLYTLRTNGSQVDVSQVTQLATSM